MTDVWKSAVEIVGQFAVIWLYNFIISLILSLTCGLVRFKAEMHVLELLQLIALGKVKQRNLELLQLNWRVLSFEVVF